jgi:hypothetical protein
LACDYAVPAPPGRFTIDLDRVSVVLESNGSALREFQPAASPSCDSGWQYSDDRKTIHLCQSTCDELEAELRADPSIVVRVKVGCNATPQ